MPDTGPQFPNYVLHAPAVPRDLLIHSGVLIIRIPPAKNRPMVLREAFWVAAQRSSVEAESVLFCDDDACDNVAMLRLIVKI